MAENTSTARPIRGIPALIAAIVAAIAVPVSFVFGISAALDGSGSGAIFWQIVFIAGIVLAVAAIVLSIVHLVRGAPKAVPVITIVVALLPVVGLLIVYIANLAG